MTAAPAPIPEGATSPGGAPDPVRVVVVEDHEAGLRSLLTGHAAIEVVAHAHSAEEARGVLDREPVAVLVLDFDMDRHPPFETIFAVREGHPDTGVVVLTAHAGVLQARRAL